MKFFTRAKRFLRWCIATPVRTGKHRQCLTDCEKATLLKMNSRSVPTMNTGSVSDGKEVKPNEKGCVTKVHRNEMSEHNK